MFQMDVTTTAADHEADLRDADRDVVAVSDKLKDIVLDGNDYQQRW